MDSNPPFSSGRSSSSIRGYCDKVEGGVAFGWVVDNLAPLNPVRLHAVIDGQETGQVMADGMREDARDSLGHPTGLMGFEYAIPAAFGDGQPHRLSFRLQGGHALPFLNPLDPSRESPDIEFTYRHLPVVQGCVDGFSNGRLKGWVTRRDPGAVREVGGCHVLVTCGGVHVAQARADIFRGDVASALGLDPGCGFQIVMPRAFRSAAPRTFRVEVMPEGIEIMGSPLTTGTVDDELEATLLEVSEHVEAMFRDFAKLRRKVEQLLPQPGYDIADYDRWARAYYPVLRARTDAQRKAFANTSLKPPDPLVSVLIPAYRPDLPDFVAAVQSVLAQTYQNWELIIVDDCSRQRELTATIKAFCDGDTRIRTIARKKNGNISEATNTAIKAARGEWIAFFDHDDLLVDVALETMVREAQRTGAEVLYSDEDKVDKSGRFMEPNFKPDWNYRYLLGCNYICHLTVVASATLAKAGLLRTKYNGSQDHDLILRLSEFVSSERIHHVAEVLYHWRKTPNSTATSLSNKAYAADAGVLAVSDHLERRGVPAKVETVRGLTLYNPVWQHSETPSVQIVIPFKDQVATTRKCLRTVLDETDYELFDITLIDNWSLTAEAAEFAREAAANPHVRVLSVEEPFNYSRLNNLAVAGSKAEFLLFMNNDLFPVSKNWLRLLVNEALTDPGAAIVAGRYVYPNGTVQHAGVVVGPNGLATHAHQGARGDDYGYCGRILLAQEMSAVTAACMLVRASVFHEIGGFDEVGFKVAYNDVDLCLRVRAAGHRVLYCAEMMAVHHESLSRGSDDSLEQEARFFYEQQTMLDRWGDHPLFLRDPAYNPHLTVGKKTFYDLNPPA